MSEMDCVLGIVIPVYNEGKNIGETLTAIQQHVRTPHRIYIVYDFDEDDTLPAAREFQEKGMAMEFLKNPEAGVANAIKFGLREAKEECLLVSMADLSDDYAGSRYMRGGKQLGGPLLKKAISRLVGVSLKYLAGLPTHDATNSFKLYRKSMLDSIEFESYGGFEIGMEILVKAHAAGYKITEVPCIWKSRQKGQSRFRIIGWAPNYLKWYFHALRRNLPNIYLFLLFLTACGLSVYFSSRGWWNKIIDIHGFRQTQTAISAYYLLKEGFTINYITPVFGAPWSVPMEFPTYQFIVATLVKITDIPLDQAGRVISLLFHYLCLVPLYFLLRFMNLKKMHVAVALAFFISSPLYAFWSRTFMIESIALFFSLMSILFLVRAINEWSVWNVTGGVLCGSMAALTKITTFSVFCVAFFMIIVAVWFSNGRKRFSLSITGRYLLHGILFLGIPLMAGLIWASHADSLKAINPLSNIIVSSNIHSWHFGSLEQRWSPITWGFILVRYSPSILGSTVLFSLLPIAFMKREFRFPAAVCLLSFIVALLVYTNLYMRHEYYLYANSVFLIVLLGLSVVALLEMPRLRIAGLLLVPIVLVLMYSRYEAYYGPAHSKVKQTNNSTFALFETVKTLTEEDEVILIYGFDWAPIIPYYSERKAIMPDGLLPLDSPRMKKAIKNTGRNKITAMALCLMPPDADSISLVRDGAELFGLMQTPISVSPCTIYGKEDRVRKLIGL
jgi:glycosyltransferase involved in cell wall biosynthesis